MLQATNRSTRPCRRDQDAILHPLSSPKRTRNNAYLSLLKFYRNTENYHSEAAQIADDSGLNVDRAWAITLEENLQQLRHTLRLMRS